MADDDKVMLQIPIDRGLHARLKIGAAMVGANSMRQYIIALLEMGTPELSEDGAHAAFASGSMIVRTQMHLGVETGDGDGEANV